MTTTLLFFELHDLRHKWGWFLTLGTTLIVLGVIALSIIPLTTIATVMVLGWLMVISGIVETVHGFQVRQWGGLPASGGRDSWRADWPAHCHSSGCRCTGMDAAVCVIFHSRRPLQNGGCNQA